MLREFFFCGMMCGMKHLTKWLDGERGRRSALAAQLNLYPSSISQWRRVPAERVLEVEKITGVSRHKLRPDIYGPEPNA
jgi:hypothetical protein